MKILKDYKDVRQYLPNVHSFADKNKSALGFLPKSVYEEQAMNSRLWVAVCESSDDFMGYLLFGGRFPSIKVFQLCVSPKSRRKGVASALIEQLIDYGEKNSFLTISARVAADLAANKFWETAGFQLVRQETNKTKSRRKINIRYKDLDTPSLFKFSAHDQTSLSPRLHDLQYFSGPISKNPIYVLDLNIFFDVVKDRLHHREASLLIKAGLNHLIRVCVTPEFTEELRKHTKPGQPDPILEFAKEIPSLPKIEETELNLLLPKLQSLIFPSRSTTSKRASKDLSDLVHIAYCIHHRASGFITREKAILVANKILKQNYSIELLSPADLFPTSEHLHLHPVSVYVSNGHKQIRIVNAKERNRKEVEQFLKCAGVSPDDIASVWYPGANGSLRRRIIIRSGDRIIGVASWNSGGRFKSNIELYLFIDEQTSEAERVIDHVLESVLRDSELFTSRTILLKTTLEQTQTRDTALRRGFVREFSHANQEQITTLIKYTYRGIISEDNWSLFAEDFRRLTALQLPLKIPSIDEFQNTGAIIKNAKGTSVSVLNLFDFETLISPGLVICPGRSGLIIPIRVYYAKDLFERVNSQTELFPLQEAILHVEKAYFRYPRKVGLFKTGMPILFYLSGAGGGSKEVMGCARITYSDVLSVDKVGISLRRQGVLPQNQLSVMADPANNIHAITFDNFNLFAKRIPFGYLRKNEFVSKANLVTVESLVAKQFTHLCRYGFNQEESS